MILDECLDSNSRVLINPVGSECKLLPTVSMTGGYKEYWRDGADPMGFANQYPACQLTLHHSTYLVDPASSHMLVSKTKPCMSKYK